MYVQMILSGAKFLGCIDNKIFLPMVLHLTSFTCAIAPLLILLTFFTHIYLISLEENSLWSPLGGLKGIIESFFSSYYFIIIIF